MSLFPIRPAEPDDVPAMAVLLQQATDGIMDAVYAGLIRGRSSAEIVQRRFFRDGMTSSYRNCWVAHRDGEVVGKLHAYPMDEGAKDLPDPLIPEARLAIYEPFDELDRSAAGSFYINTVAVVQACRGQGIGQALMAFAESEALQRGFERLSLIVFEENRGALRLYQRLGFAEAARVPAPRHPAIQHGGDLLMLLRDIP